MGCCSSYNDKFQNCEILIEEMKLFISQSLSGKFTEEELKTINKYKYEKEDKIRENLEDLEKTAIDEIQKRKVEKLKEEFYEVLDEDENEDNKSEHN